MLTKKLLAAGFGMFSGLMLAAGSAHAVDIADTIFLGELNRWSDDSGESQNVDGNGNSFLDVGDTLRGTFNIRSIEDLSGGGGTVTYGAGGVNELSGIFEIQVTSKVAVNSGADGIAGNGDDVFNYTFGTYAPFQAEFGLTANTMIALFEDTTPDYNRTGSIATAETTATNGTKVLEVGFTGDIDERWIAQAVQDPTLGTGVPDSTALGNFNLSLGFINNDLFNAWLQVFAGCFPACPGDGLVDLNASGGITGTLGSSTDYDIFDDLNASFRPIRVPEPGTLGTLGIGLLGLGFLLRTRQQKRAN